MQGAELRNWADWNKGRRKANTVVCGWGGHHYGWLRLNPTEMCSGMQRRLRIIPPGWLGRSIYSLSSISHWLKVVPGLLTPQHFWGKQACLHSGVLPVPCSIFGEALWAGAQQALNAKWATCLELPCLESGWSRETFGIIKDEITWEKYTWKCSLLLLIKGMQMATTLNIFSSDKFKVILKMTTQCFKDVVREKGVFFTAIEIHFINFPEVN